MLLCSLKFSFLSIVSKLLNLCGFSNSIPAVLPARYGIESHLMSRAHLFHEPNFSEGDSILQALYGFLFVVTCEGEVFFASRTVEQYLGFHQVGKKLKEIHTVAARAAPGDLGLKCDPKDYQQHLTYHYVHPYKYKARPMLLNPSVLGAWP